VVVPFPREVVPWLFPFLFYVAHSLMLHLRLAYAPALSVAHAILRREKDMFRFMKHLIDSSIGVLTACLLAGTIGIFPGSSKKAHGYVCMSCSVGPWACASTATCTGVDTTETYGGCGGLGLLCTHWPKCKGIRQGPGQPITVCFTASGC